jgi:hypothetical protein
MTKDKRRVKKSKTLGQLMFKIWVGIANDIYFINEILRYNLMVLSSQQALKELNSGKHPHILLLHGDDQYMRSIVITCLTRCLQRNGEVYIARQDPPFKEDEGEDEDGQEPTVKKTELNPDVESALSSGSLFSSIELAVLPPPCSF